MCYAYNAALYCDDCANRIMEELDRDGYADEGDTDGYPQYCCSDESDCPEHCDDCGEFIGNSLTSDGADYVRRAVNEDRSEQRLDSVACTVWADYYDYIEYDNWGECPACGDWALRDDDDLCVDCAECDYYGECED